MRRAGWAALVLAACICSAPLGAQQAYPTKPIRMVVPFPPGGFVDVLGRVLATKMSEGLGQNVLVDNRAGANGNVGIDAVAKSAPDGYTLVQAQISNLTVNPALYKDMPFDVLKDLAPVGFVASSSQVLVTSAASELRSVADVIATAKAKPSQLMFASSGNGSLGHLGIEVMQSQASIKFTHVPYKGAGPAMVDVLADRANLFIAAVPTVIGQVRAGKLRALAVTSMKRTVELPEVPPLHESGFPGYETTNWLVVMARAGTPTPIVERLNAELAKALASDDLKARFQKEGATVFSGTPKQLGDVLVADLAKWRRVVMSAGIKLE